MAAPLFGDGQPLGSLTVSALRPAAFDEADAELLGALATQAAIAVSNARLYEDLRVSERRYRHLVDNSPDLVWSTDADGRLTYLSESLEARTGWRPEQLIGQHFNRLTNESSLRIAEDAWRGMVAEPDRERRIRLELPVASGATTPVEVTMIGTTVDGRFAGAHGSVRDIGERERLEQDLRRQAAELAAGNERANLARELHDSVTQALFSMGLTTRSLELLLDTNPEGARAKLAELRELQRDALAEMRALIFELRPSSLEQDGLVQALRNHAAAVHGRTGLEVRLTCEPDTLERTALGVEETIYRIAQEALHNVVKHANASHALIQLRGDQGGIHLLVEDDGVGFDPDRVPRGHLGLSGMRQRAELTGGRLEVRSVVGKGTQIDAFVPARSAGADAHSDSAHDT
jgi:PAS domain S-box-containing protein